MRSDLLRHLAEFLAEFWRRRDPVGQEVYGENFCNVYESSKGIIGDPATTTVTNILDDMIERMWDYALHNSLAQRLRMKGALSIPKWSCKYKGG